MPLLVGDMFRNGARAVARQPAAIMGERTITFGQLDAEANRYANALNGLGLGLRDNLVMWADTSLDCLPLFAACAKAGIRFAPANARYSKEEVVDQIQLSRPSLLVVDAIHQDEGEQIANETGIPLARIGATPTNGPGIDLVASAAGASSADVSPPGLSEDDIHVLFFTSGSTGKSKGVVLTQRCSWLRSYAGSQLDTGGGAICMFPLFHMSGWSMAMGAWQTRSPIIFVSPVAEAICDAVELHRPHRLYLIPAIWNRLFEYADLAKRDFSSLACCDTGTSATPPELIDAIRAHMPAHTTTKIIYGSTECGPGTSLGFSDVFRKPGSVGTPSVGCEAKLADNGELCIRNVFLADGYFENDEATRAAFIDGWYHTGDLAVCDDEGFYSIVGRAKDMIRTGGEWVAPPEVEHALATHPDIVELAVVGIPDVQWGEIVTAVVVARAGAEPPTVDSLQRFGDGKLARYKLPRRVEIVDALPRTAATGQIQRALIVNRLTGA